MKALELVDRAGISYRQLDHWTHRGWLHERDRGGAGSGVFRDYDSTEVAVCMRMAGLTVAGFNVVVAAGIARTMVEAYTDTCLVGVGNGNRVRVIWHPPAVETAVPA